jgi:stage II sporulation protein D
VRRKTFIAGILAGMAPCVARASGGLDIEETPAPTHTIRVLLGTDIAERPNRPGPWSFTWRGHTYRGDFAFVPLNDGQTGLVNTVPLDAYLYGVVGQEISELWPPAAQQAQTIAARTYALKRQRPDRPYDVVAGESNQSYAGIESETVTSRAAVDATAGTVIFFNGVPADVAYSASCGGHTENAAEIWGSALPYLHGVADPHCAGMPGYAWQQSVSLGTIGALSALRKANLRTIRRVELREIDESGRPRYLAFLDDHASAEIKSDAFRSALGGAIVRSTLIRTTNVQGENLVIAGNGFGHGVGLCQWGMRVMAQTGAQAADILRFYFPGTELGEA